MEFKPNQSGFSLIEVVVALVILAIGLVGLLGISTMSIKAASDNDRWTTARIIAQGRLESLTAGIHTDVSNAALAAPNGADVVTVGGTDYDVQWSYGFTGGATSDPIRVRVYVTYPNALTGVSLTTVKSFFL